MRPPSMAEDTIMEKREELMVSPKGGDPTLRIAYFLKPSVTSIDGPVFDLPPPSLSSVPPNSMSNKRPLKLALYGWRYPSKNWKTWVSSMHSSFQSVWRKAGIHEAIMNSTYTITRNTKLILGFAERWCCETNTFVFPWGESSITLEDIMTLGGYSVVGDSVSDFLESREMEETKEKLFRARSEVIRCKARKASQNGWLAKFMAGGSDIEHEAFLAFWLSRFVFPNSSLSNTIGKDVIPIAVLLARGTLIALAPPVLASLYQDLRLLKEALNVASQTLETSKHEANVTVKAPIQFLQIWAWERFLTLQPKPNAIVGHGEPRLARWDKAKSLNIENIRLTLDSAGESFLWRPYAANNHCLVDEKLESLSLCLRVCELVGLGCIEQYLPHRVARQFGFDQDLPAAPVASSNEIGWSNYKRPIRDKKLYIPPPHCEPAVTTRYLEWWRNKSKFGQHHHQQEGTTIKHMHVVEKKMITNSNCLETTPQSCYPPGFPPKCISIESSDSSDDDRLPISEMLRNMKRRDGQPSMGCQLKSSSSSTANSGTNQMMESVVKPAERGAVMEGSATVADDASESRRRTPVNIMVSIYSNLAATEILEARVSKLEKLAAWLKAEKLGHRFL